jgi:hypothetical protein
MRDWKFGIRITKGGSYAGLLALLLSSFVLHPSSLVSAEDDAPPPKHPGMQITFLPPPMEGTLSLGIYDKKGKLVRVMAREATEKDFTIGLNGLITFWDGKDDAGKVMPAGLYSAHGYCAGAIEVEGVAFHDNDWMLDDDSPRLRKITGLSRVIGPMGELQFDAETSTGAAVQVTCDALKGRILKVDPVQSASREAAIDYGTPKPGDAPGETEQQIGGKSLAGTEKGALGFGIRKGKLFRRTDAGWEELKISTIENASAITLGESAEKDVQNLWVIDQTAQGPQVKEVELKGASTDGELKRRLVIEAGEPGPTKVASGPGEILALLEEKPGQQRIRTLRLEETTPTDSPSEKISQWKIMLSRSIFSSDTFAAVKDLLHRPDGKPFKPDPEFAVHLISNPLIKEQATTAHVSIGFNDKGSYLQSIDGLPLRRITETPGLKWTVIGREGSGKHLTIFQSDGALVEEFKARGLAAMMAFDAGEYEWTGK